MRRTGTGRLMILGASTMGRVAIACQGGGSHTAFTAGVLQESPPEEQPLLLVGAADVLTGDFKAFSSRRRGVTGTRYVTCGSSGRQWPTPAAQPATGRSPAVG